MFVIKSLNNIHLKIINQNEDKQTINFIEAQYYIGLIESQNFNSDLEINYQNFIQDYNKKDDLLDLYYVIL